MIREANHAAVRGQTFRHIPLATLLMVDSIDAATLVFDFRARRHKGPGLEL